ncbi:MAG: YicC family protein, partial [Christensenellales bacterium]
ALATEEACRNLVAAREKEGDALRTELIFRLRNLSEIVGEIDERAPAVGESYAKKLRQRIEEYLGGIDVDESRFLTEVACFVDRSNIDEEITRLKTHIKHGFSLMDESGEVGKKLDFLVQEINREINTTGSKSNDIEITQKVLAAKNELEKFREQVQNIE